MHMRMRMQCRCQIFISGWGSRLSLPDCKCDPHRDSIEDDNDNEDPNVEAIIRTLVSKILSQKSSLDYLYWAITKWEI
jgi:hypothetical protein